MVLKTKRYLGNTNTTEVHDTANEQTNCELDQILLRHRRWYDTLTEAKADIAYGQLRLVPRRLNSLIPSVLPTTPKGPGSTGEPPTSSNRRSAPLINHITLPSVVVMNGHDPTTLTFVAGRRPN